MSFQNTFDAVKEVLQRISGTITSVGACIYVGSVAMVGGVAGNASGAYGYKPTTPCATIAQGLGLCTANKGFKVFVLPGHTEAVNAAAFLTASKAGVEIIGLGVGTNRPTLTWGTTVDAQIILTGANQTWRNMRFDFTGIDAVVAAVSITASGVTFEDCEITTNSATAGAVLGFLTAATANKLTFRRCQFIGAQTNAGTTTTAQIKHEVGADLTIEDCYFTGKMTQAILNATTVLRANISRNKFHVYTGTAAFTFETSSTGFATDNRICVASGTAPVVGAALSYSGNRYTTEANGPTGGTADAF